MRLRAATSAGSASGRHAPSQRSAHHWARSGSDPASSFQVVAPGRGTGATTGRSRQLVVAGAGDGIVGEPRRVGLRGRRRLEHQRVEPSRNTCLRLAARIDDVKLFRHAAIMPRDGQTESANHSTTATSRLLERLLQPRYERGAAAFGVALMRAVAGFLLASISLGKFLDHAAEAVDFERYGVPIPGFSVYAVGTIELIGGLPPHRRPLDPSGRGRARR